MFKFHHEEGGTCLRVCPSSLSSTLWYMIKFHHEEGGTLASPPHYGTCLNSIMRREEHVYVCVHLASPPHYGT